MSVAFVLSGGGSLGAVQVGMLLALAERGIEPDLLVGTSVGAVNAAWVVDRPGVEGARGLASLWRSLRRADVFPLHPLVGLAGFIGRRDHLVSPGALRALLADHVTFPTVESAATPVLFVATDLMTGAEVVIAEGNTIDAITASAAIPGVFPPVQMHGRKLIDGGVANNFPVRHAIEHGATTVYVLPTGYSCGLPAPPRGALAVALHALNLLVQQRLADEVSRFSGHAEVHVLPPPCPLSVSPLDFRHTNELIDESRSVSGQWLDTHRDNEQALSVLRPHEHPDRTREEGREAGPGRCGRGPNGGDAREHRDGPSGRALLNEASLNKGTAFTVAERELLGIDGLLPARIESIEEQLDRVGDKYDRLHDDLERHIFLRTLQDTNEILFYRYLSDHLTDLLPIVYTPTVGDACEQFSHIYRRPHGLFLSADRRDRIRAQLAAAPDDVEVIVVTDGERILGLGDQGIGGMGIPIGKLSLYSAVGGIDPRTALPVFLDVGTNNQALLDDPLYLGDRHERISSDAYLAFVDDVVAAVDDRYPGVLFQWEDFAQHHATTLLERHRDRILSFNDDIQGTAAVALATIQAGIKAADGTLEEAQVVIVGAGSAGTGIASMLVGAGLPRSHLALVDANGLLHDHRTDLTNYQEPFARPWATIETWANPHGPTSLEQVVEHVGATILIGVSGQPGLFTESIVRTLGRCSEHPIILPLSNPTSRAEATPADVLAWSGGRALVATGSPFPDVVFEAERRVISQANNIYVFPGLGVGALAARARSVSESMLRAAAAVVADASQCQPNATSAPLLPSLAEVGEASDRIALAVAIAAREDGIGDDANDSELRGRIVARRWTPAYSPIVAASQTRTVGQHHESGT